jgi:flavin prenyltransferase
MKRLIVGITGASGAIYGIRILERLSELPIETHLIVSRWARVTIEHETDYTLTDVKKLADVVYAEDDQAAAVSSGSFRTDGMVIAPCSTKTLAAIANGFSYNLICRAADVVLKERRRLVVAVRETPLHAAHLKNMLALTEMGATVTPPVPAFYNKPASLDEMVDQTVVRLLDQFDFQLETDSRWRGLPAERRAAPSDTHDPRSTGG